MTELARHGDLRVGDRVKLTDEAFKEVCAADHHDPKNVTPDEGVILSFDEEYDEDEGHWIVHVDVHWVSADWDELFYPHMLVKV